MPRRKKEKPLPLDRGIQYMQLEFFKLYSYCVDQGILKKSRRQTPMKSSSLHLHTRLEAAEVTLIRLFGSMLKSIFDGSVGGQHLYQPGVAKMRNVLEFTVLLPDGEWWQRGHSNTRPEIDNLGNAESAGYDRFVRFLRPNNMTTIPRILVAPDREPGSTRWNRRRFETLLKEHKSRGHFYDAAKAVVAWKERMDTLMTEAAANVGNGNQNTD